jgi:vacuolar-type H+-ATPase subunit H
MDVLKLLDMLEDVIEESSSIPFAQKAMVDKEEVLEIIREMRVQIPDELKQAKWIKEERQRILAEAQNDADTIIEEAHKHINSLVDDNEIARIAKERGEDIIQQAQESAKEMRLGARDYADEVLEGVEGSLRELLETLQKNRSELKGMDE